MSITLGRREFSAVVMADFEFTARPGERSVPICAVFHDLVSDRTVRLTAEEMRKRAAPPFSTGPDALWVAYYSPAEWGCFLALGWTIPCFILDLFVEHRCETNGIDLLSGDSLLGALACRGLSAMGAEVKAGMRELAMRGGEFSPEEMRALIDYCWEDVRALERLFRAMWPRIDGDRALLRGCYMGVVAEMEWRGIPVDMASLTALRSNWGRVRLGLIESIDREYGVYEGESFRVARFTNYLLAEGMDWPVLGSGALALDDDTFKQMALLYPRLAPLRELRRTLAQLRLQELAVGADGRNRVMLSPFRSKTGRNQPSTSKSIFGGAAWLRSLIKPVAGSGIAYVDWSQQEFGIAAALSGDEKMLAAYESGDPYLAFARQAGAVPAGATKDSHPLERERFKACLLGTQYAIGAARLATNIGRPEFEARALLKAHRRTYEVFWRWIQSVMDVATLRGELQVGLGWRVAVTAKTKSSSLQNFPMQAVGAEMLRLACIYARDEGVQVIMPVHDALLIEAAVESLDEAVVRTRRAMARASRDVLAGFELRTDSTLTVSPNRYSDQRGSAMWAMVMRLLAEIVGGDGPWEPEGSQG